METNLHEKAQGRNSSFQIEEESAKLEQENEKPKSDKFTQDQAAWIEHAVELSAWAKERLFSRTDTYAYWQPKANSWKRSFDEVRHGQLLCHFRGELTLGSYSIDPIDNSVVALGLDIDAHDDMPADPVANLQFALDSSKNLQQLGFQPLLEDSNGTGGFHLLTLFDGRVDAEKVFAFGNWLVRNCPENVHVEVFPKQASVPEEKFGNQLRLPGKHHKRQHWSRVFDFERHCWLSGEEAIKLLLNATLNDPTLIPNEALEYAPPKRSRTERPPASGRVLDFSEFDGDIRTLDIQELCEDRIIRHGEPCEIECPWADEHSTGDGGAFIWEAQDDGFPGFYCHHAHCEGRDLSDLLGFYGKEAVDRRCEKLFPTAEAKHFHELERQAIEVVGSGDPPEPSPALPDQEPPDDEELEQLYETSQRPKPTIFRTWDDDCAVAETQSEDWWIEGISEFGALTIFTGRPFSGKSSMIGEIIACMANDSDFCHLAVAPVPFLLLDYENRERTLIKRIRRALGNNEGRIRDLYRRVPALEIQRPLSPQWVGTAIDALRLELGMVAEKGVVIVDTLRSAKAGAGRKENDESDMTDFLFPFKQLAAASNWAVVILHHNAKASDKYSGSSAIPGVADYMWNWRRPEGSLKATLEFEGRDDYVEPFVFEFDVDQQRNFFKGRTSDERQRKHATDSNHQLAEVLQHCGVNWMPRAELKKKACNLLEMSSSTFGRRLDDAIKDNHVEVKKNSGRSKIVKLTTSGELLVQNYQRAAMTGEV